MTFSWSKNLALTLLVLAFLPLFLLAALLPARRNTIIWGSAPLIHFQYWSDAMRQAGFDSMTIMTGVQKYDSRDSFDRFFDDFVPRFVPGSLRFALGGCFAQLYVLRHASMMCMGFVGFFISYSPLRRLEPWLFRLAGIRMVLLPFGADGYIHSRIIDQSLLYGLLAARPDFARRELDTLRKVNIWKRYADATIVGLMVDGLGRYDVATNQPLVIDTEKWDAKPAYSDCDGVNGPVRIAHAPSSRGFKGTEFVLEAVETLRSEGLKIELDLIETVPNSEVKGRLHQADILAEQFLAIGYGTNGLEGLACGLPVMANLSHEAYTRVFRRFGFLNECPIVSTTPESMTDNLRVLVRNPALREQLGRASRAFAEKYHSFATAAYMFGAVHDKIVLGKDIDTLNLFNPRSSPYSLGSPRIEHPLFENLLPEHYFAKPGAKLA